MWKHISLIELVVFCLLLHFLPCVQYIRMWNGFFLFIFYVFIHTNRVNVYTRDIETNHNEYNAIFLLCRKWEFLYDFIFHLQITWHSVYFNTVLLFQLARHSEAYVNRDYNETIVNNILVLFSLTFELNSFIEFNIYSIIVDILLLNYTSKRSAAPMFFAFLYSRLRLSDAWPSSSSSPSSTHEMGTE